MGYLLNGIWHDGWYDAAKTGGEFVRPDAAFRDRITADGSSGHRAEVGRYHLYVQGRGYPPARHVCPSRKFPFDIPQVLANTLKNE